VNKIKRALKEELLERYHGVCEHCGQAAGTDINHCLFHQFKGCPNELHTVYNCTLSCRTCNETKGNSRDERERIWAKRCGEFGRQVMLDWWESVELLIKDRFG
jgi:hypothetical protein